MTMSDRSVLVVEFLDDEWQVDPAHTLGFGRAADVVLDAHNPFLHRVVGVFSFRGGVWMLHHVGSRTVVTAVGPRTVTTIDGGGSVALVADETIIRCVAGAATYELVASIDAPAASLEAVPAAGAATVEYGWISLNDEQRALLAALATPMLLRRENEPPPNRAVAARLGWSITKFNRKLDHLCAAADRAGVSGVAGDLGRLATQRRARLVEHAVRVGLVTAADVAEFGFDDL